MAPRRLPAALAAGLLLTIVGAPAAEAAGRVPGAVLDSLAAWHRDSRPDRVDSLAAIWLPAARASGRRQDLGALLGARGRTRAAFGLAREAEPDLREALRLAGDAGDTAAGLDALRWLSVAVGRQGRTGESLALACSLQTLAVAAGDSVHLGWAWLGRAYGHHLAGRAGAAGDLYARAGGVLARHGVPRGAVWARNGEGLARRQAGDFEGAMAAFQATARLAREAGDALSEAMALTFQGRLELLIGDPAAAARLLDQAVAIHDHHHHHREGLLPRIDLAAAHRLAGRRQAAAALLDSVRLAAASHGLADLEALAANNLADLHLAAGRPGAALALVRGLLARGPLPSRLADTEARLRLARGLAGRDSAQAALRVLDGIGAGGHGARSLALAAGALQGRLLLRLARPTAARELLEDLGAASGEVDGPDEVLHLPVLTELARARLATGDAEGGLACFARAVALWDTLRARPADPFWRERRSAEAGDLFAHAVAAVLAEPAAGSAADRLAEAFLLLQRYKARTLRERILGPAGAGRDGRIAREPAPGVDLARLRSLLAPGEVFLDAVTGRDGGVLMLVAADTALAAVLPPGPAAGGGLLTAVLTAGTSAAPEAVARLAADRLGRPEPAFRDRLATADRVFWCPDGDLHGLPLAVLLPGAEIARVPSAGWLAASRGGTRAPAAGPQDPRILALVGPAPGAADGSRLRGGAAEAAWLAARLAGVRRRAAIDPHDRSWRRARILHLAAHVESTPGRPWRAALVLGDRDQARLRAQDVAAEPLACELVTLAGCRTAGGDVVGGEGLLGLATGFLAAGAPLVLATLWDVDDHAAVRLTTRFYEGLAEGRTAAGALAAARQALREDPETAAHRHWSGFVLLGDGARAVPLQRRRTGWPLASALLLSAALLLAAAAFRRRSAGRPD